MVLAKLFVLGQERELLWTDMGYERDIRKNGKPSTEVMGGLITVCYESQGDDDIILRWLTIPSEDDTWEEVDKMAEGKVCFYDNDFDYPPTKTYKFNDALLIYYKEVFFTEGIHPMKTIITISPAIQNYGTDFVKRWNVSWIPPEETPYQAVENGEPKVLDYYLTNLDGQRIDQAKIGEKIYLNIETTNLIGKTLTISLNDKNVDFKYKDEALKDDTISNYKVNNDLEKLKLEVILQQNNSYE